MYLDDIKIHGKIDKEKEKNNEINISSKRWKNSRA